ncbi:MAG TPA: hypothetical protein VFG25_06910 [Nitrosopumilaceae archaeon]|nr:hypothetical protein [Nitrosopumilaceae archaeon]
MTSLKTKSTKTIVIIIIAVSIGLLLGTIFTSCSAKHIGIINDIKKFKQTLEPEFCETIVERIDLFNDECEPKIEIIDCG